MPTVFPLRIVALLSIPTALSAQPLTGEPAGLHQALDQLAREGQFSGAVVLRGPEGVRFARAYGWADPFENRAFAPETPADSGSLAKPVTSAAVLLLIREGKIEIDAPVNRYLPEYPDSSTTIRHLLSHSAGITFTNSPEALANKGNAELLAAANSPLFKPGTAFTYCNLCFVTLALLIERVSGIHYLEFARTRLGLPAAVSIRPARLTNWTGRAIGFRRKSNGEFERFDSWEGETFYGPGNLSISAAQLAEWGSKWWEPQLGTIRELATTPARINRNQSGLTLGNWYCAQSRRQCHYLGHHEGFHHMLYWDSDRRISLAMVSNNALSPALQQRLQRALIAFATNEPETAKRELQARLPDAEVPVGQFKLELRRNRDLECPRGSTLAPSRRP